MAGLLDAHAGLAGKVAVVVGGAAGVGRAVTLALADAGIDIAACDIDTDALPGIAHEVEKRGRKIVAAPADVCDIAALDRFYDTVEKAFDRLDIVVNLAGGVKRRLMMDGTRELDTGDIRRNFGYVVDSTRRAVHLIRRGGRGGSIINFTTIEAHRGAGSFAVYAGAKAATENFTRAMAVELGAERIRVNAIAPDTTPSKGSATAVDPADRAKWDNLPNGAGAEAYKMYIPQKEAPSEEDLANGVLFLASDLSRAITGITLHIDGGTKAAAGFLDWPFGDGFMPCPMGGTLERMYR
jgi:NAD(P)-dependent dehydrogenase (short-subunit alcohol dehydrogenase family)